MKEVLDNIALSWVLCLEGFWVCVYIAVMRHGCWSLQAFSDVVKGMLQDFLFTSASSLKDLLWTLCYAIMLPTGPAGITFCGEKGAAHSLCRLRTCIEGFVCMTCYGHLNLQA